MKNTRNPVADRENSDVVPEVALAADIVEHLENQKGMSLAAIARLLGVSRAHVTRIKRREKALSMRTLFKLEEKLGVPLPKLFVEIDRTRPKAEDMQEEYRLLHSIWSLSAKIDLDEESIT